MNLTPEQLELLDIGLFLFLVTVGAIFTLKMIFKQIARFFRAIKIRFIKQKNKSKKKQGYKNFKGNTWYPDGTVYNAETRKLEKPDYKN